MSAKRKPVTSAEPSTKKVKFEWVEVDELCPPYLVNFNTTPDVDFLDNNSPNSLKFQVTTRGSSDKTSLTALRKNMVYHGEPNDAETSYYVGVFNKKSSTLKFVPTTGIFNIKQTFTKKTPNTDTGLLPLTSAERYEKLINAVTKFGSKNSIVAKKAKREKEFKVSAEDLDKKTLKKMTNTITEKSKQEVATEAPYDIPPPNMSADSVDEVYTLISDLEKQLLPLEEVREFMKTSKVLAPWTEKSGLDKQFFDALNKTKIKEMGDNELATRLYLMYFAGFLKNLAEEVKGIEGKAVIPKPLQSDLFAKFSDRKALHKNKVINYLCVFYLTLNDYVVNVTKMHEQISDLVRVDLNQLEKHFRLIGGVVRKAKEEEEQGCRFAELRLPLKFSWK